MAKATGAKETLKETFNEWKEDEVPRLGAALAYYTIFALAPLLIIAIGLAGIVVGEQAAEGQVVGFLGGMMGEQTAQLIETMVARTGEGPGSGIIAAVSGVLLLLIGASGVFSQLQGAMNKIWNVAPSKEAGLKKFVKKRLLSIGMVFALGFLLLVSLLLTAAIGAVGTFLEQNLPGGQAMWFVLNQGITLLIVSLFFASVFKVMPDAEVRWRDVWLGAVATAVLFLIGQALIGLYLGNSAVMERFGPASALVGLLIWVYYSAQIMFFGAEFTQVWARRHGRQIEPSEGAVRMIRQQRAQ
jgi:membrane protein